MPPPTKSDGDPGKPGRLSEEPRPAPPPAAPPTLPAVRHLDFDALAPEATPSREGDSGYGGMVARDAVRLEPLVKMQSSHTQIVGHAETIRRGEPWLLPGGFAAQARGSIAYATRCRDVLAVAHAKADAALARMTAELSALEQAMSDQRKHDDPPTLTTTGGPHPLVEGGYDPGSDPQKPADESAIAGLKAGHATRAQAEALAAADTAEGSTSGGPGRPGTTPDVPAAAPPAPAAVGSPGLTTPASQPAPAAEKAKDNPMSRPPADKK